MSAARFKPVFFALMSGAFLCAFVLPERLTDSARLHAAGIFNPISLPIRRLAQAIQRPFERPQYADWRSADSISTENDELRQEIARLTANVDRLQRLEDERQNLGDLKSLCVRAAVAGGDAGGRDGLLLSVPSAKPVHQDDPVLYSGGLAGRLQVATGAARVRLITDEGFAVTGAFIRFTDSGAMTTISAPTPLVRGLGHGQLAIVGMKFSDYRSAGLHEGDWVVLDDPQWPPAVQGIRLGRISWAHELRGNPLFADIRLSTQADLTRLGDVWVFGEL